MSHSNLNETFVLACLGIILAAPFLFRVWLNRFPVRTLESVDRAAGNFSTFIFVALFIGGFVFDESSRRAGLILLLASVFSFYVLYQSRWRYLKNANSVEKSKPRKTLSRRIAFGKIAVAAIFLAALFIMARFPVLMPVFFFSYPFFVPYSVRLQNACTPMADSALKTEIQSIFKRAHVKLKDIYVMDSGNANSDAMMAKNTLFVTIDLFQKLNEDEIKAVISHEASHLQQNHLWKRLAFSMLYFFLGIFWILFPAAFIVNNAKQVFFAIPLIAVFQLFFVARTIRRQEHEADLGAIRLGASSEALISALQKLSAEVKMAPTPRFFTLAFHPENSVRAATLHSGVIPTYNFFQHKKYAFAYSLMVLGFVFHQAQNMDSTQFMKDAANRAPAETRSNSAKVSHSGEVAGNR